MVEDRKKLSSLIGRVIVDIVDAPRNGVYFVNSEGQPFAQIDRDDIFDEEGNRFEDDI